MACISAVSVAVPNSWSLPPSRGRVRWNGIERRSPSGRQQQCTPFVITALNAETASTSSSSESSSEQDPPIIQLEFIEVNGVLCISTCAVQEILREDSRYEPQTFSALSGENNLRKFMLENKLEVYALYGKLMNCGGGGSCGTCTVEILEGQELLSERTDAEYKYLKKKPESWRLSCQTIVGNNSNSGKVVIQQLPQKKK